MAWKYLQFERLQVTNRKRSNLPCDVVEGTTIKKTKKIDYKRLILKTLKITGPVTARELGAILKIKTKSASSHCQGMTLDGVLQKIPHAREREDANGHMECWLYDISA